MNKRQYEALQPFEKELDAAVNHSFLHLSNGEFNKIYDVYVELYGELRPSQKSCNSCKLKALQKIGVEYFEYKNKPKVGRPPKLDV